MASAAISGHALCCWLHIFYICMLTAHTIGTGRQYHWAICLLQFFPLSKISFSPVFHHIYTDTCRCGGGEKGLGVGVGVWVAVVGLLGSLSTRTRSSVSCHYHILCNFIEMHPISACSEYSFLAFSYLILL